VKLVGDIREHRIPYARACILVAPSQYCHQLVFIIILEANGKAKAARNIARLPIKGKYFILIWNKHSHSRILRSTQTSNLKMTGVFGNIVPLWPEVNEGQSGLFVIADNYDHIFG